MFKLKDKQKTKKIVIACVSIILILVILLAVAFIPKNNELYSFDKDVAVGIDVSEHNKAIDWKRVSKKVDFAFVRVGYRGYTKGNIKLDSCYEDNLIGANKYNVPVGVYFYSQATSVKEARDEAKTAISAVSSYKIDLPIVIDFEYAYDKKGDDAGRLYDAHLTKEESTKIIKEFCKTVEKAGYTAGVYASTYMYYDAIDVKKLSDKAVIWVADYNKEITYNGTYDIWQYSSTGKLSGVKSKYVDFNYWYK